jgi:uncharacterized protein
MLLFCQKKLLPILFVVLFSPLSLLFSVLLPLLSSLPLYAMDFGFKNTEKVLDLNITGPVYDEVGLFSSSWKSEKESLLQSLYESHQVQIQIAVVKNTKGLSLESFSIKLAEKLRLGKQDTDRGLLVLLVPEEKQVRLEVGQGLEGDIPDIIAKRIIQEQMLPHFRQYRYEKGLDEALIFLIEKSAPSFESLTFEKLKTQAGSFSQAKLKAKLGEKLQSESGRWPFWVQVLLVISLIGFQFVMFIIFRLTGGSSFPGSDSNSSSHIPGSGGFKGGFPLGGGGWGGSGGGGWSGGGGGFSGGGASGRW